MIKKLLMTFALVVSGTGAVQAAETVYTTRAAFNAATTGQVVDTFGTASGASYVGATPYVRPGYSITANDLYLFNNNPNADPGQQWYSWGTGNVMFFKQNGVITLTFDAPITAFGIELGTLNQNYPQPKTFGYSIGIATPSSELNFITNSTQTLAFFGFTSTTAFSSITLYGGANNFTVFDNVTLASAATAAVPETATWLMMILGFGLIGAGLRSRRTTLAFAA